MESVDQGQVNRQIMCKARHVHVGQIDADLAAHTERAESFQFIVVRLNGINIIRIIGNGPSPAVRLKALDDIERAPDIFGKRCQRQAKSVDRTFEALEQVDCHQRL